MFSIKSRMFLCFGWVSRFSVFRSHFHYLFGFTFLRCDRECIWAYGMAFNAETPSEHHYLALHWCHSEISRTPGVWICCAMPVNSFRITKLDREWWLESVMRIKWMGSVHFLQFFDENFILMGNMSIQDQNIWKQPRIPFFHNPSSSPGVALAGPRSVTNTLHLNRCSAYESTSMCSIANQVLPLHH